MSEFALDGPELKKMIRYARKDPLPFAFNPGKTDTEHYFALHRKRPARALGKAAKEEGVGKKAAFGTCRVEGKVMKLECEVVIPTMAKALKKFLKANKISLNVEILDASGQMVESDIEDLPDDIDDDEAANLADASEAPSAADLVARMKAAQQSIAAAPKPIADKLTPALKKALEAIKGQKLPEADKTLGAIESVLAKLPPAEDNKAEDSKAAPKTGASPAELAKRLAGIKGEISALEGPIAEKLNAAFAKVVAALKGGKTDIAAAGADQLEAALAKTKAAPAPPPPPPGGPDPQLMKLSQLRENFRSQAELLENKDTVAAILKALEPVSDHITSGDKTSATAMLTQVRALLEAAKKAQVDAKAAADTIPEAPGIDDAPSGPEYDAWMSAFNQIEPNVSRALSEGLVEDVSALRLSWSNIVSQAEAGDFAGATMGLPDIQAMLDAGRADGDTAHLADVPDDVRPFAVSRIKWNDTRKTMLSEVAKLEAMIKDAIGDDEDFEMNESLTAKLENLDTRLSDALDKVVNAPEGERRSSAKSDAQAILKQYQDELSNPFFADVDNNSGFGSVAVASTAKKALGDIAKVLA